jgi:hypothetical protein
MKSTSRTWLFSALLMAAPLAIAHAQTQSLSIDGRSGSVPVTQINGKNYVDIEALARLINGTVTVKGNQVLLTLPAATAGTDAIGGNPSSVPITDFSRDFLRAAIEAMSNIREWHSALASAIENQYMLSKESLAPFQSQAMTNLRLAQTAVSTDADRKGAKLVSNVFDKMKQLNDKYLAIRANASYIATDALKNDALDQSIVACGHALGAMAASGVFSDDVSCH